VQSSDCCRVTTRLQRGQVPQTQTFHLQLMHRACGVRCWVLTPNEMCDPCLSATMRKDLKCRGSCMDGMATGAARAAAAAEFLLSARLRKTVIRNQITNAAKKSPTNESMGSLCAGGCRSTQSRVAIKIVQTVVRPLGIEPRTYETWPKPRRGLAMSVHQMHKLCMRCPRRMSSIPPPVNLACGTGVASDE